MIKFRSLLLSLDRPCVQHAIKRSFRVTLPATGGAPSIMPDLTGIITTQGVDGPLPGEVIEDPNKKPLVQRPDSQWDLYGALCLQRMSIVVPPSQYNAIEARYHKILQKIEIADSVLSDHEIRHREDVERQERLKKGTASDEDMEMAAKQSAQDYEDLSREELNKFKEWLVTQAKNIENNDDRRTSNRHLSNNVTLVVKQLIGTDDKLRWLPPLTKHQEGETLKQTAERALAHLFTGSPDLRVKLLGGVPLGYYHYNYPKKVRSSLNGKKGAKVFIMKGQLIKGSILDISKDAKDSGLADDFCWLTTKEMKDLLHPALFRRLSLMLYEEEKPTVEEVLAAIKNSINRRNHLHDQKIKRQLSN